MSVFFKTRNSLVNCHLQTFTKCVKTKFKQFNTSIVTKPKITWFAEQTFVKNRNSKKVNMITNKLKVLWRASVAIFRKKENTKIDLLKKFPICLP